MRRCRWQVTATATDAAESPTVRPRLCTATVPGTDTQRRAAAYRVTGGDGDGAKAALQVSRVVDREKADGPPRGLRGGPCKAETPRPTGLVLRAGHGSTMSVRKKADARPFSGSRVPRDCP